MAKRRGSSGIENARSDALRGYFGYDGTLFVWKIFCFQIFEVALQSYGKNTAIPHLVFPLRLPAGHMYKKLREGHERGPERLLPARVRDLLLCGALVNVLPDASFWRNARLLSAELLAYTADTVLDVIYALVPFVFLALGVRSQPMIIPHYPIEYTSALVPHAPRSFRHIGARERGGRAAGAAKSAVATASGASDKLPIDEEGAAAAPGAAGDEAVSASKYAPQLYAALVVACVASWCVAFCAIGLELQITTTALFFVTSLAAAGGARRRAAVVLDVDAGARPRSGLHRDILGLAPAPFLSFASSLTEPQSYFLRRKRIRGRRRAPPWRPGRAACRAGLCRILCHYG